MGNRNSKKIETFGFEPGDALTDKYQIVQRIGSGWEGEVYLVRELATDIERAAKCFFPHRNPNNTTLKYYAKKLYKLRSCPALIQYSTQDTFTFGQTTVSFLISDYVEGAMLSDFLKECPGKRLTPFQGLHLLHALVKVIEEIHRLREYHGDIHEDNIIIAHYGLRFDIKLVDLFRWKESTTAENMQDDIVDIIRVFYEVIGGVQWYAKQSPTTKSIIMGMRRPLIIKKFRTATKLREYLEHLEW